MVRLSVASPLKRAESCPSLTPSRSCQCESYPSIASLFGCNFVEGRVVPEASMSLSTAQHLYLGTVICPSASG